MVKVSSTETDRKDMDTYMSTRKGTPHKYVPRVAPPVGGGSTTRGGRPPIWPKALALKKQKKSLALGPYKNEACAKNRAVQFNKGLKRRLPKDAEHYRFKAEGNRVVCERVA